MQRHILFVDDSPTMRASVTFCLRNAGYLVTEAENGLDALDKLQQMWDGGQPPALILTDVNMPEMDGITFITKVKKGPSRFVPVLVLTTEGEKAMIERGRSAGASGWLLKPFQPEQLLWAVKKLVWPT
jgi:two-component system, chemotaxis family, chemotaxis protein CheY